MPLTEIEMSGGKFHFGRVISNPGWDLVWEPGTTCMSDIRPAGIKMEEDGSMVETVMPGITAIRSAPLDIPSVKKIPKGRKRKESVRKRGSVVETKPEFKGDEK